MHGECSTNLETDDDDDDDGNDNDNDGDNNNDVLTTIMMLACTNMSFCVYQNFLGS